MTQDEAPPEVAEEEPEGGAAAAPEDDTSSSSPPPARPSAPSATPKREMMPPPPERLEGSVEAVLLAAGEVLRIERLRDLLAVKSVVQIRDVLESIAARWTEAGLAVELEEVAGGVRVVTRPEYAEYVQRLSRRRLNAAQK